MSSTIKRKIFFWILVVLFFITAPALILYSLGYRFNSERNIFIYSGSVTLKPSPQQIDVYVDDKKLSNKKINFLNYTYHLDGIRPGDHIIKVVRPEFQPWSKKITVQSGLSTEFWNVFLAQENYTKEKFNLDEVNDFFISPKDNKAAIVKENKKNFEVAILDIDNNEVTKSFIFEGYSFTDNKKENIEWSPRGNSLIIPAINNETNEKEYIITDSDFEKQILLSELTAKNKLTNVRWDPLHRNHIFFLSEKNLFKIDSGNKDATASLVAVNTAGFDLSKSGVYYLNISNGIIHRKSLDLRNEKQITTKPIESIAFPELKIIVYDEDRLAVINGDETLYVYNNGEKEKYMSKFPGKIQGLHFSNDGKKLLYWTDREIFVHFLRRWDTQPIRQENETRSITRFSQEVDNVHWYEDYEHVIFSMGNKIKISEIDHRSFRNTMDLIELEDTQTKVVSNFKENWLLFLDTNADKNNQNLYYIDFLEIEDES